MTIRLHQSKENNYYIYILTILRCNNCTKSLLRPNIIT